MSRARMTIVACAVAAAVLPMQTGHAKSASATYVTGGISIEGAASGGSIRPLPVPDQNVAMGGASFTALPFKPYKIKVAEGVGGSVGWLVCQDGGDGICGQGTGDISQEGCSTGRWQRLSTAFRRGRDTSVFVRTVDTACEGNAITGTITLRSK